MSARISVAMLLLAFHSVSGTASAGIIVVTGDVTPVFFLTNTAPNSATAGNTQFFSNVLGSGNSVVVLPSTLSTFAGGEINQFYGSLPGVTSALVGGTLTSAHLQNVDLLLVPVPDNAFTSGEIAAIDAFVDGGGSLFLMGEGIAFGPATNAVINSLLAGIGSTLSLTDAQLDSGSQVATGAQIAVSSLTAGVSEYSYGATAIVNGGTPLFLTSTGQSFVAFEGAAPPTTAVPEPSTITTVGLAFLGFLGGIVRHQGRSRRGAIV